MEDKEELKNCPFCGSKAFVGIEPMSTYWSVGCTECFCHFDRYFETKEIAIEVWNIRKKKEREKDRTIIKSIEEIPQKVLQEIYEYIEDNEDNEDNDDMKDFSFEELIHYIQEVGKHKEDLDSCYLYSQYTLKLKSFKLVVTGSSYRKDQSICDEELNPEIAII